MAVQRIGVELYEGVIGSALSQKFKIPFTTHSRCPHISPDYFNTNVFIFRNDYWAYTSCFQVASVIAGIASVGEAIICENAVKGLPVLRTYACHCLSSDSDCSANR